MQVVENIELRPHVPPDPIEIRIPNSILFPLQHLEDCLGGLKEGVVFSGIALKYFRESNRTCQRINTAASVVEGVIATTMLRGKGKLSKAVGLSILAHAGAQAKGAVEKSIRQVKLDSKDSIGKEDL